MGLMIGDVNQINSWKCLSGKSGVHAPNINTSVEYFCWDWSGGYFGLDNSILLSKMELCIPD